MHAHCHTPNHATSSPFVTSFDARLQVAVVREEDAQKDRAGTGVPDQETVFSQARNSRLRRLEDSLNADFPVDSQDDKGNTLLLIGAQNCNRKLMELVLARGSNINHQNAHGNSALHFVMAYDTDGTLGEFLIQKGANDTLANVDGLTPYDGIGAG